MDPFSITTGVLGITQVAVLGINELRKTIVAISGAGDLLHDIRSDLEGIQRPLTALRDLSQSDKASVHNMREALGKTGIIEAVNECGDACAKFNRKLQKWTRHSGSNDDKLSLRDRIAVGVWNKEQIRTMRVKVESCRANVQLSVQALELTMQLQSQKASEAHQTSQKDQLQQLEARIHTHIDALKQQRNEIEHQRGTIQSELEANDDSDTDSQLTLALQEVEEQSYSVERAQITSGVLFTQVRAKLTNQDIGTILTSDNSIALVGLPASVVGRINQRIWNVTTQHGSVSVVGVFDGDLDMRQMFKN